MSKTRTGHAAAAPGADNNTRLAFLESRIEPLMAAVAGITQRFAPDMELAAANEAEDIVDFNIRLLAQVATHETPCDRRIAELEGQLGTFSTNVSLLAIALSGAGIAIPEDGDPILVAISAIEGIGEDASHGDGNATQGEIVAIARADAADARVKILEGEIRELQTDVEELANAKNELANKLAETTEGKDATLQAVADENAVEPAAAPEPRERPEYARDIGPTFGSISRQELAGAIAEQRGFEVAFSNGEYEIVAFQPVHLAFSDLQGVEGRHLVVPSINVRGAEYAEDVHGAGLLLDGEQIAYCTFPERLVIRPGEDRAFNRALIFG